MNTDHAPLLQTFEDKPNGLCRHVGTAEAARSLDTHIAGHTNHWTHTHHTDHWTHTSLDTHITGHTHHTDHWTHTSLDTHITGHTDHWTLDRSLDTHITGHTDHWTHRSHRSLDTQITGHTLSASNTGNVHGRFSVTGQFLKLTFVGQYYSCTI